MEPKLKDSTENRHGLELDTVQTIDEFVVEELVVVGSASTPLSFAEEYAVEYQLVLSVPAAPWVSQAAA